MNLLWWEKTYPFLLGTIASIAWYFLKLKFPETDAIISATLSVSGIFVGFLATAKAILMSMSSPLLRDLKESGYMAEMVSYISQAIWGNLLFCVVNVAAYFSLQKLPFFGVLWIFSAVVALMTFIRVTHIMLKIFEHH